MREQTPVHEFKHVLNVIFCISLYLNFIYVLSPRSYFTWWRNCNLRGNSVNSEYSPFIQVFPSLPSPQYAQMYYLCNQVHILVLRDHIFFLTSKSWLGRHKILFSQSIISAVSFRSLFWNSKADNSLLLFSNFFSASLFWGNGCLLSRLTKEERVAGEGRGL